MFDAGRLDVEQFPLLSRNIVGGETRKTTVQNNISGFLPPLCRDPLVHHGGSLQPWPRLITSVRKLATVGPLYGWDTWKEGRQLLVSGSYEW